MRDHYYRWHLHPRFHCASKGCGKSFHQSGDLRIHELTHTDIKQAHCPFGCHKKFSSIASAQGCRCAVAKGKGKRKGAKRRRKGQGQGNGKTARR